MLPIFLPLTCFLSSIAPKALTAMAPISIPGGPGSFDFMNIDNKDRLGFACQPGRSALVVLDLEKEAVKSVPLGVACNGMSFDYNGRKAYAAGPGKTLVQLNMDDWSKTATLALDGPGDSVVYDGGRGVVYVDNDDGTTLWVVDPATMKVTDSIVIKEAPEVMVLDSKKGKIYQNIKSSNSLQVIDVHTKKVEAEYTLGDLTSPHGLAQDRKGGKLFAVGKNGKLVILETATGHILSTLDVTKGSDQIAYDSKLKRLYIPGSGVLQIIQISDTGATILDSAPVPEGCHSVIVDPTTHNVWVAYTDKSSSYVMKYVADVPKGTSE